MIDGIGQLRMTEMLTRVMETFAISLEDARMALPDWWDDEAAGNDAGFSEACLYTAQYFHVSVDSLRTPGAKVIVR